MIINNKFIIKSIKNIIFFGYSEKIGELIKINNFYKIKSTIVTTSNQKVYIDKKFKSKIVNKLDRNFLTF